jgi:hypothetical protein
VVAIYVRRTREGLMTIDEVPPYWKTKVQIELDKVALQ